MHVCIGQLKVEVIVDIYGSWQSSFQFPPPIRTPNSHFWGKKILIMNHLGERAILRACLSLWSP